jgi:hypothetical protein
MTDEQIEKTVTEAVYGSDSHHWPAEAQVRKALAVARKHSTARIAELEAESARLREALIAVRDELNVGNLDERWCCSDMDCGCYGMSRGEYLLANICAVLEGEL